MKTVFTFLIGALVSFTGFAANGVTAAYQPSVTISAPSNFEILIDGRSVQTNGYNSNSVVLNNLKRGQHNLRVYELRKGLFGKSRRQISSSNFMVDYNDVYIMVDRNGSAKVQQRNGRYDNSRNGYSNHGNAGYGNNYPNRRDVYNNGNGNGYGYGRNKAQHKNDKWDKDRRDNDKWDKGRRDNKNHRYDRDDKKNNDKRYDNDHRRNDD
ncbi:MAG TPA: hypothetical protein VIQ00_15785 [Chitinophagaceae bacterium]